MENTELRFVALDLHATSVMVAALDASKRVVLPPRRILLDHFADWATRQLRPTDQVVLEATTYAWYIYDMLEPLVARILVADPAKAKAKMALPVKTDKRDTLGLAELLVTNNVPEVWVPPVPVRELRWYCCNEVGRYNTSADEEKALAMKCIRCASERTRKDGQTRLGGQRWRCNDCGRRFTARSTSAFSHHGFPDDVIALAVRWYVRYRLSYADVVEWFVERGLVVDRSTIYRWVRRFLPLFGEAARVHRRPVSEKWRVDETYVRLQGRWTYVYRAIDQDGQVVDAYFSQRRNADAAEGFFRRCIDETGVMPTRVTTDKAKCYPPALRVVLPGVEHRTSKYLNNGIERDHGHLKQRLYPMRGFKQEASADVIVRGHALIRNLRNGFSTLTVTVPLNLRLAVAWPQLALAI